MLKGACNCGANRFQISTQPDGVYVCHCSICRRHTGTNGNAVVVVENAAFQWLSDQSLVATWDKPGCDWQIWFCRKCGSQLPGRNDEASVFIPAGLIDVGDDAQLQVVHHIFVDSKAPWDVIGDQGKQHACAFQGER